MTKRHLNSGSLGPRVGIAWQGGANHGAFSWGVARALLPELERREIPLVGMIGASAGAKNAVYAAQGWLTGEIGHKAIQADLMLERLWFSVAEMAAPLAATMQMGNPLTAMGTATDQFGAMMGRTVGIFGALASGFMRFAAPSAELEAQLPAFEYAGLTARHGAFLSAAINDRRMEILLNASVEAELRTLPALAQAQGRMLNLHVISVPPDWPHSMESMTDVRNTNWAYFKSLRDEGQRAGEAWVHEHGMDLGQRSSYVSGYRVFDGKAATHPMSHIPRLSAA